jgi:Cu2+-exporting ATPase
MKEHEHTANHEPAAKPGLDGAAKDSGSKHPAHQGDHADMAADFRKRFWISLILTLPILALSPMLQSLLGLREAIRFPGDLYVLFGFSTAVFGYGGWVKTETPSSAATKPPKPPKPTKRRKRHDHE